MDMRACEHMRLTTLKPFIAVLTLITWQEGEGRDIFILINAGLFVSKLWIFIICSTVQLLELMDSYAKTCPLWLRIVPTISCTCYSTLRNLYPSVRELIPVKVGLLQRRFHINERRSVNQPSWGKYGAAGWQHGSCAAKAFKIHPKECQFPYLIKHR